MKKISVSLLFLFSLLFSSVALASNTYTVQAGDVLWKIAEKYHYTIEGIKQDNGLSSDEILVGQTLWIPDTYEVQQGDTLGNISSRLGVSVENLLKWNSTIANPNYIDVGQFIVISEPPNEEPIPEDPDSTPIDPQPEADPIIRYVDVEAGDTVEILKRTPSYSRYEKLIGYVNVGELLEVLTTERPDRTDYIHVKNVNGDSGYISASDQVVKRIKPEWQVTAERVLGLGVKYLGTPYKYGARGIFTADFTTDYFDCSSFTQAALWAGADIKIGRGARQQWNSGGTEVKWGEWRKGDLIFTATTTTYYKYDRDDINFIGHVGFFYGYGEVKSAYSVDLDSSIKRPIMLHTWGDKGVRFEYLDKTWLEKGYFGAKRFIP